MDKEQLTHTKSCKDCYYNIKGMCFVDFHIIEYFEQAYSCKYYKKYKKESEENESKQNKK